MTETNRELAISLAEEAKQRIGILNQTLTECGKLADASVVLAWEIGEICLEAKEKLAHGQYMPWLELVGLEATTASRYVKLRTNFATLQNLAEANARREGYLALIVPNKERPEHDGDVRFKRTPTHLAIVNDFERLRRRIEIGKAQIDADEVRKDMRPLYEWLRDIFEKPVNAAA